VEGREVLLANDPCHLAAREAGWLRLRIYKHRLRESLVVREALLAGLLGVLGNERSDHQIGDEFQRCGLGVRPLQ
jgi:hypothetical protein